MRLRVKAKMLQKLLSEDIVLADKAIEEIAQLRKRVAELEETCENFTEVEESLHQRIAELSENNPISLKKRLVKLFS